jgi:predicted phage tail component-like protein
MIRGFTFNGKHIYKDLDYKLYMHTKSIQSPSKKKIKESVPFMNGSYDFSTVATNGEPTYNERVITLELGLPTGSKEDLYRLYSRTLEWLVDSGKCQLIFDDMIDYYFMAEVESQSTFEEVMEFGKLTVVFTAEPFKRGIDLAGDEEWDTFNFEEDYMQDTEFDVTTTKTLILYNPGRAIMPIINCNAVMNIVKDGVTYNLIIGDNRLYKFRIQNGANNIIINGTGHIRFLFRKEVL